MSDVNFDAITDLVARGEPQAAAIACDRELRQEPRRRDLWHAKGQVHLALEQWGFAEIALRTAHAYGASSASLREPLETALVRQGTSLDTMPLHLCNMEPGPMQSPGAPDVVALVQLTWQVQTVPPTDMLEMLRTCPSMDAVLGALMKDARFSRANLEWLAVLREDEF
ncbi:hypothetical protein V5740_10235 [Croceibacterium sp. TMG7-5b_MA50]|uniref:hypothetical protein n=1 Tax=Croceibacterium sp. TMG7-5b_MA50 TaxID=3121290 RepID=UPI0032217BA0